MQIDGGYRSEREVEVNLLKPLFHDVLGYPESELEWAKRVKMTFGHETRTKEADLVAHYHGKPVVTVEAKKPTQAVRSGLSQVDSYAFALETPYSVVTNGRHLVLRGYYSFNSRINVIDETVEGLNNDDWKKLRNLISFDNIPTVITEPPNRVTPPDEARIKDYRRFFRKIHSEIRDRDRLDPAAAFDELSKLLFLKAAEDEWQQQTGGRPVLTPDKIQEWEALGRAQAERMVNEWFRSATMEMFRDVFEDHPSIRLAPSTLRIVLDQMRPFHVRDGDVDVKGRAFEEFLPSQLRGKGLGQYFTPRPIVNFMADMASISMQDVVVDFACGSGGFLIKAFEQMQLGVEQLPTGTLKRLETTREELLDDIKVNQIFGIDAEPRAARTAKMNMLMWGDGRRVVRGNALDTKDFTGRPFQPKEYSDRDPRSGCSLILTNPPFGSKEKDPDILKHYVLGSKLTARTTEKSEVLFIEKGIKLLRPEGKMLIVIPQGLMSGSGASRVRDLIHSEAEIRAIISLPTHTFVQSGVPTVNTCIVYVQKFTKAKKALYDSRMAGLQGEALRTRLRSDADFDYPIFMGSAEFIGYEPSGRSIVGPNEETDLDLLLKDFAEPSEIARPDIDIFEFASQHYSDRSSRRKDQVIRGTVKGLKTAFVVKFSETQDRLDPPFYFWRYQAGEFLAALKPLGPTVKPVNRRFKPETDDELDAEYPLLSVSSDGLVTLNERLKGEAFNPKYIYKRVERDDIVYNPSRINIGSIGVVPESLAGSLISPEYVVFRSTKLDPQFLVTLFRSPFYRMYIDVVSSGSIRDRLYARDLPTMRVPEVSPAEQLAICEAARRADDEMRALIQRVTAEKANTAERLHNLVVSSRIDTTDGAQRAKTFKLLVNKWRRETGMHASPKKKVQHPAYQQIIAMGDVVVPLILRELEERPAQWFEALRAITGETPVPATDKPSLKHATEAWLQWGKAKGLIS